MLGNRLPVFLTKLNYFTIKYTWLASLKMGCKPPGYTFRRLCWLAHIGLRLTKSRLLPLQRKIDELERALGRKALEVDILKKFCELKDFRLPEGM